MQFEPTDDPTLFPLVGSWLESLRDGPRGADGDDFTIYKSALIEHGYKRLFQLASPGFSVGELQRICGEQITEGLASVLIDYARRDTQKIVAEEIRRLRSQKRAPHRYY